MIGISVEIREFVGNDTFPGLVRCYFKDAKGLEWEFVEKTAIVSKENLQKNSDYPLKGVIGCKVLIEYRTTALVSTKSPFLITSVSGESNFEVSKSIIVEYD